MRIWCAGKCKYAHTLLTKIGKLNIQFCANHLYYTHTHTHTTPCKIILKTKRKKEIKYYCQKICSTKPKTKRSKRTKNKKCKAANVLKQWAHFMKEQEKIELNSTRAPHPCVVCAPHLSYDIEILWTMWCCCCYCCSCCHCRHAI